MSKEGMPGDPPAPVEALDRLATALDAVVPVADTVGNSVLVDDSRTVRWGGALFGICAIALIPWTIYIALSLPKRQLSPNYDLAWSGYDVILFLALACTTITALRRSRYLALAASWTAAMLVVDAWFDVMTSPGGKDRLAAVGLAAVVELPLAGVCLWMAVHSQDIADARLRLVLRTRRTAQRPAAPASTQAM